MGATQDPDIGTRVEQSLRVLTQQLQSARRLKLAFFDLFDPAGTACIESLSTCKKRQTVRVGETQFAD